MTIYNASKIASQLGFRQKKDYARLLLFMGGYREALNKKELATLQKTLNKETELFQNAIDEAKALLKK